MSVVSPNQARYQQACGQRTDRKLAVLVPCFRAETFIVDTLNSIQAQEGLDEHVWAVVLAPDCSPDNVLEVARSVWTSPVPLLIDEREQNVGEMRNVNAAVNAFPPNVEWFLNMHGDNIAKPGWLLEVAQRFREVSPRTALIATSYDNLLIGGRIEIGDEAPEKAPELIEGNSASIAGTLCQGCWWHNSTGGIRVAAFKDVGGLPQGMRQKGDWKLLLKLLDAGWGAIYVARTRMLYRENDLSVSSANFRTHLDLRETLSIYREYEQHLDKSRRRGFRWMNIKMLSRRTVSSILRGDFSRAFSALRLMPEFLR